MRLLYAVLCLMLVAWAAFAAPPAQHPIKVPQAPGRDSGVIVGKPADCPCNDGCPCGCERGQGCGCKEIIWPDLTGRKARWMKPLDPKLPWQFKGWVSTPLTIGYQSEYTSPFNLQCSGPA